MRIRTGNKRRKNKLALKFVKCDHPKCNEKAVWDYAPSDGRASWCDKHVPRGCSCNIIDWDNPETSEQMRDRNGKLYPCIEYWYWKDGFLPSEDRK